MTRKPGLIAAAVALLAVSAPAARAQSLADVLTFLVTNQSVPTGSVERDRDAAQAASDTISRALLANLATLPVPSSSSAFVYRLNPELGTVERPTQTFGTFFLERALTAGRGQASAGLTLQHVHFASLDGRSLGNGSLVTTANQFADEAQPFDVDQLTLDIDADVATLYGSIGVTKHLEIGAAVPMMSLSIAGSRVNTYRGRTFTQASARGRAIGVADVVARAKYTFYDEDTTALAAAVDVRLPTGREQDLLGAGEASYKLSTIGSIEGHRASAHANIGLTVGGLATEFSYGGAVVVAAGRTLSLVGEVLGRWIRQLGPPRVGDRAASSAERRRHDPPHRRRLEPADCDRGARREVEHRRHVGARRERQHAGDERRAHRAVHSLHRARLRDRQVAVDRSLTDWRAPYRSSSRRRSSSA